MMTRIWLLRGLLAALLLMGGEVVLWADPATHSPLDWLLRATGYLALSALLLDWMARYQVRELFGLLALTGVYGLLAGLFVGSADLLHPLYRVVTLALGAYTALGLAAWQVLLRRGLWWLGAGVGLAWGIRVQAASPTAELSQMLLYGGLLLAIIGILWWAARDIPPAKLNLPEWVLVLAALAGLLGLRWNTRGVDPLLLIISGVLVAYCWMMLWFQQRSGRPTLLDTPQPVSAFTLLIAACLFLAGGVVGYGIPFGSGQQRDVIMALFTAFGMVWLPTVSLVVGVRAYRSATRQKQL